VLLPYNNCRPEDALNEMKNINQNRRLTDRVITVLPLLVVGIAGYLLFSNLSVRQTEVDMQIAYRSLALNTVLVAAALAAGRLPALFLSPVREKRFTPAALAAGYVLAGFGIWRGLNAFSEEVPVLSGLGLTCLTAGAALAVSQLAVYAERYRFGGLFRGLFEWFIDSRSYFVTIALGIGVYAFIVRPLYIDRWMYSVLIEWIIILLLGILLLGLAYFRIERNFVVKVKPEAQEWQPHRQVREPRIDSYYTRIRRLERRFIGESDRTMLVHFMVSLLAQNEVGEPGIVTVLRPVIEYPESVARVRNIPAKSERERLLRETVGEMQTLVRPGRYASGRTAYSGGSSRAGEPETVEKLADVFCREGDRSPLLVRLSLLLDSCDTRDEYIDEILRMLLTYRSGPRTGQRERERLWQSIKVRVARYAPKISLKE
jgi:hypothetical protein